MIYELEQQSYHKVLPLLKSNNELSVLSVISGMMYGKIFVNDTMVPTTALIKTSECNLIAGDICNAAFNESVTKVLDFWDTVTPDSEEWHNLIPQIHENRIIRKYQRCRYVLDIYDYCCKSISLPDGYLIERVDFDRLRTCGYKNADELLDWMNNWGNDCKFNKYGVGAYIRNQDTIVSWSISDCAYKEKIAIGMMTDELYRKKGFAKIVVNEVIRLCSQKGYKQIQWLCVDCNKGSKALAEKTGFHLSNHYDSFAPYAPVENLTDLSEQEWESWAEYFEDGSKSEKRLLSECIYTYVKANNYKKVKELLEFCENRDEMEASIQNFISYLHTKGMASNFINIKEVE